MAREAQEFSSRDTAICAIPVVDICDDRLDHVDSQLSYKRWIYCLKRVMSTSSFHIEGDAWLSDWNSNRHASTVRNRWVGK